MVFTEMNNIFDFFFFGLLDNCDGVFELTLLTYLSIHYIIIKSFGLVLVVFKTEFFLYLKLCWRHKFPKCRNMIIFGASESLSILDPTSHGPTNFGILPLINSNVTFGWFIPQGHDCHTVTSTWYEQRGNWFYNLFNLLHVIGTTQWRSTR